MSAFVYKPTDAPWTLSHSDARLLVVNKPAELLSVPGRSADKQDCLIHRVQERYPEALLVHRLDLATSGLMVFARDREAQGHLGGAFNAGRSSSATRRWSMAASLRPRAPWSSRCAATGLGGPARSSTARQGSAPAPTGA